MTKMRMTLALVVLYYLDAVGVLARRRLEYDPGFVDKWRPVAVETPERDDEARSFEDDWYGGWDGGKKDAYPYGADGGLPFGRPPEWLVPLFYAGADRDKVNDGVLAGHAIRVTPNTLLAHGSSVRRAAKSQAPGGKPGKNDPAICGFDVPDQFYDTEYPTAGNNYHPVLSDEIAESINIYGIGFISVDHNSQPVDKRFPMSSRPPLPSESEQWGDQCYLLAYGRRQNSSLFYLNQIYLKRLDKHAYCVGDICSFDTVSQEPRTSGLACGPFSVLGAPVVCEQSGGDRVSYMVISTSNPSGCTRNFKALDLSKWRTKILDRAQKVEANKRPAPGPWPPG